MASHGGPILRRGGGRHRAPRVSVALRVPLLLGAALSMVGGVALAFLLIGAPLPTVGVLLLGAAGYLGWRLWRPRRAAAVVPAARPAEPIESIIENESAKNRRSVEPTRPIMRRDRSTV